MADSEFWQKYKDPRWQEKRLRIMERAGFRCQWCDQKEGVTLNVHHGYYRKDADPWDYEDETLWCLCEDCHAIASEHMASVRYEIGLVHPLMLEVIHNVLRLRRTDLAFKSGLMALYNLCMRLEHAQELGMRGDKEKLQSIFPVDPRLGWNNGD